MEKVTTESNRKRTVNIDMIDEAWRKYHNRALTPITQQVFKNRVKAYMIVDDITTSKAIKKALRSTTFTSPEELARENVVAGLKKFPDVYKQARDLSRWGHSSGHKVGTYRSLKENVRFEEDGSVYFTDMSGKKIYIDYTDSPQQISLVPEVIT